MRTIDVDAVVVGGGIAGLWTLDELTRRGYSALLVERTALGDGQTVWSQGIIHGGLKYSLKGMVTGAAASIREMPGLWRARLAGDGEPNLSGTRVRSEHCWVWQTKGIGSRIGMMGARAGLRVSPEIVPPADRPQVLRECPGVVARLGEQVIDPVSLLKTIAEHHATRIVRADVTESLERDAGGVRMDLGGGLGAKARCVVLCAGAGNATLRERLGLDAKAQQVRPLRMVMLRGENLPELNGHCVDMAHTRITITSDVESAEGGRRRVWQIGGDIAERGASMEEDQTIDRARAEIIDVLPGLDLRGTEWATYLAPRAEGRTSAGGRPDGIVVLEEGCVITAWPTKLVLAPALAERVCRAVLRVCDVGSGAGPTLDNAQATPISLPPWERDAAWHSDTRVKR